MGIFRGEGSLIGGNFPGGSFPDTGAPLALQNKLSCFESGERFLIDLTLQDVFFFLFLASTSFVYIYFKTMHLFYTNVGTEAATIRYSV